METKSRRAAGARSAGRPRRDAGWTLVELIVATALTSALLAAGAAVTLSVTRTADSTCRQAWSQQGRLCLVPGVAEDLRRARVVGVGPDGASLTYSLPVISPETGTRFEVSGDPCFGIADAGGQRPGGTCTIAFEVRAQVSESALRRDLNGDGDLADHFDKGTLTKRTDAGTRLPFLSPEVLLPHGDHGGDVDGDGTPDPIFEIGPGGTVTIALAVTGREGVARQIHLRTKAYEIAP